MPRTHPPVVRRHFDPKEALEIQPEKDWEKIYSLPWDEVELTVLEAVERKGSCLLENHDAEPHGYGRARDFAARLNIMFRAHNLDFRFTSAFTKNNYWGPNKLVKF